MVRHLHPPSALSSKKDPQCQYISLKESLVIILLSFPPSAWETLNCEDKGPVFQSLFLIQMQLLFLNIYPEQQYLQNLIY